MEKEITKYIHRIQEKHPDAVILFRRCNDNYVMLGKDAYIAKSVLSLPVNPLTLIGGKSFHSASFQFSELDTYLPKFIRAGFRVAICELPNV